MQQATQQIVQSPATSCTWTSAFEAQTMQRTKKGSGEFGGREPQPHALDFSTATSMMSPQQLCDGACFASPCHALLLLFLLPRAWVRAHVCVRCRVCCSRGLTRPSLSPDPLNRDVAWLLSDSACCVSAPACPCCVSALADVSWW